ncbi:MAG: glycoside hydrolase family 127 protein [Spirochaetales bacterium]|nr:glycoside hydrolase family 127 protein [Spirochaetales bacterium]
MLKCKKKPIIVSLLFVVVFLINFGIVMIEPIFADDLLQEFSMDQIAITDSYYENAFNKMVNYLQALDPDRLLVGFRQTAGLSTSTSRYGGWENSLIQGHTMGHYMVALAQAYKNTNNSTLRNRIDYIITQLQECQNRNGGGYLFATSSNQFDVVEGKVSGDSWVPWYTMHKIMTGLIEIYKLAGNSTALTLASNLGNWIYNRTNSWSSSTQSRVLGVEYGGMNDCLYELYKLTGNNNHLTAAHKFDETSFFNTIASGTNNLNGKHANTQIPKFVGACNRYRALGTSENSYLTAAEQFWNIVLRDCTYVTGGNSQNERFRAPGQLNAYRDHLNNETCNSYNMLKLTRGLFLVTGDVKYADYYERAYINEILASQNPDTGMTTYFKPMGTGFFKVFSSQFNHFWCCTGTGMENFTKLSDSIYFNNGSDLYVNMYISSTLNWNARGIALTQQADIPLSNIVSFTINSAPASAVRIKFRSPYWIASGQSITVRVNGSNVSASNVNGYVDVNRTWAYGDTIEITLPMEVQISRCTDNQNVVAFSYGPVVLSAGLGTSSMTTSTTGVNVTIATKNVPVRETINIYSSVSSNVNYWLNNIQTNLVRTAGKLEFTLRNTDADDELVFTPHYKRYTDRYGIYFNLAMISGGPTAAPNQTPVPTTPPSQDPIFNGGPYSLNGTDGYEDLPDGITHDLNDFSIACWVKLNSLDTWARIFDFGNDTNVYMMLTPASGNTGYPFFCITLNSNDGEQGLNGTSPLSTGSWQHFAVTRSGNIAILYINSQEVARNTGMTLNPSDMGNTTNNYIGRSQWSQDPYLNGEVDDFVIYNRALSASEVSTLGSTSPDGNLELGDANGDGVVDIVDALIIAQSYVGLNPPHFIPANADTNCDGNIDIVDALLIAQYYVGLLSVFC